MVQTGSKNILLDNVDNNYAPVIYTRQSSAEKKHKKQENLEKPNVQVYESSHTGSVSSDDKNAKSLSLSEDNSLHKQQRVAEWVQNLDEIETSGSEISKSDQKRNSDAEQQLEKIKIEKNKEEQKPIRKISNGKQKYQSLPQTDTSVIEIGRAHV